MMTLVEAKHVVALNNGEKKSLTDNESAGAPLLYLQGMDDKLPMKPIVSEQLEREKQEYKYNQLITQIIREKTVGKMIKAIAGFELFHRYIMQDPVNPKINAMLVPLLPPIKWRFSIRVERVIDGCQFCKSCRKLKWPIVAHNGLKFSLWHNHILQFRNQEFV